MTTDERGAGGWQGGHARTGQTLRHRWRLDRLLSVSSGVAVYAATHRTGARATIKILHLDRDPDARARDRFVRDGYLSNAVSRPGALRVLDDGMTEDGAAFLVLEGLDGESLEERRLRRGGGLPIEEVLTVADELLALLVAAHERGLTGADLEPDRLFLARDGSLRLLDFGVCRAGEAEARPQPLDVIAVARAAAARSSDRDEFTAEVDDLRRLGTLLRRLSTGHPEPEGAVPAPLASLLAHPRSAAPDGRWPSARSMRQVVKEMRSGTGPGDPLMPAPPPSLEPADTERILASDVPMMAGGSDARLALLPPAISLGLSLLAVMVFVVVRCLQGAPVTASREVCARGHVSGAPGSVRGPPSQTPWP